MAPLPLPVMMSRWQNVDLWWEAPNQWLITHELPVRRITDIETLDLFGDEALRRRDEVIAVGYNDYSPEVTELISRRVVAALKQAGWAIEVDEPLGYTGDTFRAVRGSEYLRVRVRVSAGEDHFMQLECVGGVSSKGTSDQSRHGFSNMGSQSNKEARLPASLLALVSTFSAFLSCSRQLRKALVV